MNNEIIIAKHLEKGIKLARRLKHTPISSGTCNSRWMYDNDEYLRETAIIKKQIGEEEYNLTAEKWFAEHQDEFTEIMGIYTVKMLYCGIGLLWCLAVLIALGYFFYLILKL